MLNATGSGESTIESSPMLLHERDTRKVTRVELPNVRVVPYDEKEETTCIETATLLTESCIKKWLLVPLISLLSLFVFPVFLYWKTTL